MDINDATKEYVKRVNSIIIRAFIEIFAIHLICSIAGLHRDENSIRSAILFFIILFSFIFSKSKIYGMTKYLNIIGLMLFSLSYYDYMNMALMLMAGTISLSALYFDEKLFKATFIFANIIELINQYISTERGLVVFIISMVGINLIMIVTFINTKVSSSLVEKSAKEAEKAQKLLNKIEETMNIVEESTLKLDESIRINNKNIHIVSESENNITKSIKETAIGAEEQSNSLEKVNTILDDAKTKFIEAYKGGSL